VSYSTIKESSRASSLEELIKNITLMEKVEDFCKSLDQITGYRFNYHGRPEPDIYYMRDIIKIRLMEIERLQTQRINELIK
jgi:hypothetical protein